MKQTIYNQSGAKVDYEIPYEEVGNIKFHNVGKNLVLRCPRLYLIESKAPKTL